MSSAMYGVAEASPDGNRPMALDDFEEGRIYSVGRAPQIAITG